MDGTVDNDDARLVLACYASDLGHIEILTTVLFGYPSAIEPQNIDLAIARKNLVHLLMGEVLELLPSPRVLVDRVVNVATFLGINIPPIILSVPVGLREIGSYGELLRAECIENILKHIATWIVLKRMFSYSEVGFL